MSIPALYDFELGSFIEILKSVNKYETYSYVFFFCKTDLSILNLSYSYMF